MLEKIQTETQECLENNYNKNTHDILWKTAKTDIRGKVTASNTLLNTKRKKGKVKIMHSTFKM